MSSQNEAVNFWSLPTDSLNIITGYIGGLDIFSLCNCGNRLLLAKLVEFGAVTQFKMEYGVDVTTPHLDWRVGNWSTLKRFKSLESLEFIGFERIAFRYFTTREIKLLNPENLRIINFQFIEALNMWVDWENSPIKLIPFNIGKHFPNLEQLMFRTKFWDTFTIYKGKSVFRSYGWDNQNRMQFISYLPQNLEKLEIVYYINPKGIGAGLPPNLKSLRVNGEFMLKHTLGSLPSSLTELSVPDIRDSDISNLPRTLQKFTIRDFDFKAGKLVNLPNSLEFLDITIHYSFSTNIFKDLTNNYLTSIHMRSNGPPKWDDADMEFVPRSLTDLRINYPGSSVKIGMDGFKMLPTSLTRLEIGNQDPFPWSIIELLWENLRLLKLDSLCFSPVPGDESLSPEVSLRYWKDRIPAHCKIEATAWMANTIRH